MSDIQYELWTRGEGVSITKYDIEGGEADVLDEWWFTWAEVFAQLTGVESHAPSIHSEP